jgi:hypothetical protein
MSETETLATRRTVEEWCHTYTWWEWQDKDKIGLRILNSDDGRIVILDSRDPETLDKYRNWEVLDWYPVV